jgi:hypothetical protein
VNATSLHVSTDSFDIYLTEMYTFITDVGQRALAGQTGFVERWYTDLHGNLVISLFADMRSQ